MRPEVYDVMFATATTASLKKTNDVVIMLKNHERALHVNAGGKVTATDISSAQFFSMEGVGDFFSDTFTIALYAKEVGRYLCFRRGKLVGMKNLTRDCHFIESLDHGYFLYANAYNPLWRVGFTKGLKPVGPRHWKRPQTLKRACFLFVKINAEHFDRSRFTTTTTVAPSAKTAATADTLREGQHFHDSKASIIDSNSNNYKRTKSANNNGQRLFHINSESANTTGVGGRSRHRKRKHHAKLSGASITNGSSSLLQPKNLVRHHHDQGNGEGRRRQHQREQKERKQRLKNQRRQQQEHQDVNSEPEPMPNVTNSATPSVTATTVAATASLAPSALNIVAMLAAGRRKRGRRKKPADSSVTNLSSNSGHHQAMDLQLVAQSPLQAQSQYDRLQLDTTIRRKSRHHHDHNYLQQQQQNTTPVSSASRPTKEHIKVQQQNHKYSNINTDSQLYTTRRSSRRFPNRRSGSNSSISNSDKNIHNLSHNYNLHFKHNVYEMNSNNNNNNNDTINATPALPKKYLSKANFNQEYLMQQTTRNATDLNTKRAPSHSSHSSQSHSSHDFNKSLSTPQVQLLVASDYAHDSDSDRDSDYIHEKNSNRLLVNSSNIRDNNLQQEQLVNRFKLIYLDRIRSHSLNLETNNKVNMQPQYNHYNGHVEKKSPTRSTITTATVNKTTKKSEWHSSVFESTQNKSVVSANVQFEAYNNNSSNNNNNNNSNNNNSNSSSSSRSIKKNRVSRSNLEAFTTSDYNRSSHRRTKRNLINNYTTNGNNNNNKHIYDSDASKDYIVQTSNKKYAKMNSSPLRSGSHNYNSSSSKSFSINNRNINNYENKVNDFGNSNQEHFEFVLPSTAAVAAAAAAAYRKSKLFTTLSQQQKQQILKIIYNPNKYNNNYYSDTDYEKDDGGKFEQIQNKYEKIIVQYRSVFNCLEVVV